MARVSVLVPAFHAGATFERSLSALHAQTYQDFDLIVIETGQPSGIGPWLAELWPTATFIHQPQPLLPHDALNVGLQHGQAELCAFTDIDAYPEASWLAELVDGFDRSSQPVAGSVACYGSRWLEQGAHLAKFDKWLDGLEPRLLREAPTVNLLIPRSQLEALGWFQPGSIHADTDLCWRLCKRGGSIHFVPGAVVYHHHLHSWGALLKERFQRGADFTSYLIDNDYLESRKGWWIVASSLLPLRLGSQLLRVFGHAAEAGVSGQFLLTLPVIASALYAWLLGEIYEMLRIVGQRA